MPLNYNLQVDLFDVWGICFMGQFLNSHGFEHILMEDHILREKIRANIYQNWGLNIDYLQPIILKQMDKWTLLINN